MQKAFSGERILVVDDDHFGVSDLVKDLQTSGADVLGPIRSIQKAMQAVISTTGIQGAVLDINIQGSKVFSVADMLQDRRIPVVFMSACDGSVIPTRHAGSSLLAKPFRLAELLRILSGREPKSRAGMVPFQNRVIAALPERSASALADLWTPLRLAKGDVLARPEEDIEDIIFVEQGIISIVAEAEDEREIEVGLIGREGFLGAELLLEDRQSVYRAVVQVPGRGFSLRVEDFRGACEASPELRSIALRYLRSLQIQTTFGALANGKFNFEHRLARWLLMVDDRVSASSVMLTHDCLALTLGAHRPGVTIALQALEGRGFIRSLRGEVQIRDRAALLAFAGGAYGVPEREYRRLVGFDLASPSSPGPRDRTLRR